MPQEDNFQTEREHERQRQWVESLLTRVQQEEFYGKLTLTIRKGRVETALKEESLKLPQKHP